MQLMSIEDLSVYLGDSKRTIYKYIASGDCPPYMRISAKNIKFDRADVDAWLESKKVSSPSAPLCLSEEILPWAPRALRVTKLAEKEAKQYGLDYVGTEHLLTAIMHEPECIAAIILKNLGVDSDRLQKLYESLCPAGSTSPGASHGKTDSKTLQNRYHTLIVQAADKYNLEPEFIHAVITAESSYRRKAVSKAGAKGLMQLMPVTARRFGVDDPFDPKQSIHAGALYLNKLLKEFKSVKRIKEATLEELTAVIGTAKAQIVKDGLGAT